MLSGLSMEMPPDSPRGAGSRAVVRYLTLVKYSRPGQGRQHALLSVTCLQTFIRLDFMRHPVVLSSQAGEA